jgi:hypothetical protein
MSYRPTPFDSIESAQEFMQLLAESVEEAARDTEQDMASAASERQLDALRLVAYKLHQLREDVRSSSRLLNDLRSLRRLLLNERLAPRVDLTPTETVAAHVRARHA